jgi:hypothetical protein
MSRDWSETNRRSSSSPPRGSLPLRSKSKRRVSRLRLHKWPKFWNSKTETEILY